jgi:hypothetical protein
MMTFHAVRPRAYMRVVYIMSFSRAQIESRQLFHRKEQRMIDQRAKRPSAVIKPRLITRSAQQLRISQLAAKIIN